MELVKIWKNLNTNKNQIDKLDSRYKKFLIDIQQTIYWIYNVFFFVFNLLLS